jgi:sucrose-6-phosphate hydrolase SacC (GH32 family)
MNLSQRAHNLPKVARIWASTADGIRMFAEPVKEIEKLYKKSHSIENMSLAADKTADLKVSGDIFDIRASFAIGNATAVGLDIGGEQVTYDVRGNILNGAAMKPVDGQVSMQVLVDRPMLEIVGNHGRVFITKPREKKGEVASVKGFADGGEAKLLRLEVNELKSIWGK